MNKAVLARSVFCLLLSLAMIGVLYCAPVVFFSYGVCVNQLPDWVLDLLAYSHPSDRVSNTASLVLFSRTMGSGAYKKILSNVHDFAVYDQTERTTLNALGHLDLERVDDDDPSQFVYFLDGLMKNERTSGFGVLTDTDFPPIPGWADCSERDGFGLRVGVEVGHDVKYFLRWCPVETGKGFWVGETEVTNRVWNSVMKCGEADVGFLDCPVVDVSYDDCVAFAERLGARKGGVAFTMPSESQWEHACTGGIDLPFVLCNADNLDGVGKDVVEIAASVESINSIPGTYNGCVLGRSAQDLLLTTCFRVLGNLGWFKANSNLSTHDVRNKSPNILGIYDMHGNAMEWCRDLESSNAPGDQANVFRGGRVAKGGSFAHPFEESFKEQRCVRSSGMGSWFIGFRLVVDAK